MAFASNHTIDGLPSHVIAERRTQFAKRARRTVTESDRRDGQTPTQFALSRRRLVYFVPVLGSRGGGHPQRR